MRISDLSTCISNPHFSHPNCVHRIVSSSLHKGIIDRNDKDLPGLLQLGVVDVARNMGAGAGGA
jgi:hypothetical protein